MKREHDAAGPNPDSFRDHGQGSASQRRIWIQSTERVEVPFRSPDRSEPILVSDLCSLHQQSILVFAILAGITSEIEEAKIHAPSFSVAAGTGLEQWRRNHGRFGWKSAQIRAWFPLGRRPPPDVD